MTSTPASTAPTLVIAATGKTGRRVADQLEAAGGTVRRASRSSATRFDWEDPSTWAPALEGAAGLYLVPPEGVEADLAAFVAEVERSTVERLVLLSAREPGQSGDDHLHQVEATITAGTTPWTILRPAWFAQNFDEGFFAPDLAEGTLRLPVGEGREPFIDADDIAAVAVAALTATGHEGRTYELSGPETLSFAEAVATIAEASGRALAFEDAEPDAWADGLRANDVPAPVVSIFSHLFAAIRAGDNDHLSTGVADALGRPPTSFATWAAAAYGATV